MILQVLSVGLSGNIANHSIKEHTIFEKLQEGGIEHQFKFESIFHTDSYGRKQPCYELTQAGVLQLAARYDAVVRAKLIELAMNQQMLN